MQAAETLELYALVWREDVHSFMLELDVTVKGGAWRKH